MCCRLRRGCLVTLAPRYPTRLTLNSNNNSSSKAPLKADYSVPSQRKLLRLIAEAEVDRLQARHKLVEVQIHHFPSFRVVCMPVPPRHLPVTIPRQQVLLILRRDRHLLFPVDLRPGLEGALRDALAETVGQD